MTTFQRIDKPFSFIIFGASGDLAKLKLFPAIYELALQRRFPKKYAIYGYARSPMTDAEFRSEFKKSIREKYGESVNADTLGEVMEHLFYRQGGYDDPAAFRALAKSMVAYHGGKAPVIGFYSVPPLVLCPITENLAAMRRIVGQDLKIILEKPLGSDEKSATELFHFISRFFDEENVFLLDHYLGKTPVQSILPLRYNNTILDVLLQGDKIANIQISALETLGVKERAGYFDDVGIIKDMIQSHLLQIFSLITMAIPVRENHKAIKREKMHVLSALRYGDQDCAVVLGQYKSYRREKGVRKNSSTPTFAAIRGHLDLADWYEVPVYLRTGKKLGHKHTYVAIEFKKPLLKHRDAVQANRLVIELAPEEKIEIRLVDARGQALKTQRSVVSGESLACMGEDCLPEHGRLILDAFLGNHTYFVSFQEVIAAWQFVDRVMRRIEKNKIKPIRYADGSDGPEEQHSLTACDNFKWYDPNHS